VGGQFQAPAVSPLGNMSLVSIGYKATLAAEPV